jgi:FKBP-type peptidyl-prolyl cis-trans isomerase
MTKSIVFVIAVAVLFACGNNGNPKQTEKKSEATDLSKIIKEFSLDVKLISYAYGQQLRLRVNQETMGRVMENQFIEAYLYAKESDLDLNALNQKMYASKQKSQQDPNFVGEFSKDLGLLIGTTDSKNLFLANLDLVNFAEGFKDAGINKNKLMINSDSLVAVEQNKFHDFVGKRFLAENKKQAGVITTASGLQYKIISKGKGKKPNANSEVTVHYTGKLISGEVFDSSVQRGESISFNLQGVIPGWTEGLQLMPAGSKFEFYIPQEIAYGAQAAGSIPAFSTLVFEVELISFK